MKTCTKCHVAQPFEAFARDAKRRDGLQPHCKSCFTAWRAANRDRLLIEKQKHYQANADAYKARAKARTAADPERKRLDDRRWREENLERKAASDRAWYDRNRERKAAYDAAWRTGYYAANKHLWTKARSIRRGRLMFAMPAWVDAAELAAIYERRAQMEREHGQPYEVDHIVPLAGKNVCGLHVPWNLRIVPKAVNRSKGNRLVEAAFV